MNSANWNLLLLSLVFVAGCGKKTEEIKPLQSSTPVTAQQSGVRTMERQEESVGTLESFSDPVVSAEVAGKVLEIRAPAGSAINSGQILAVIDAQDVSLSRQAALSEVRRLETLSNNQTKNLERLKQLREKNFISPSVLDDATAQASAMQSQLETARTQLALAERNVSKTQVLSPVDGRVEKQIAVRGQYVKVGDPLFQVVALNKLRVRLPFPENLSGQLQRGMRVRVSSSADDLVLEGKIEEIRPMAGVGNRAFDVFVTLDNPGAWKPGASVVAKVVLGEHQNAVVVPEQSVVIRPAGKVVYVVNGDKVEQRLVQVGIEQNGEIEILSGLRADETVVVDGAGFLTDKAIIAVKSRDKPAASAVSAAN
jgi:RND family efflux transporter MFP subunit